MLYNTADILISIMNNNDNRDIDCPYYIAALTHSRAPAPVARPPQKKKRKQNTK